MVLESAGDAIVAARQYQAETREIHNLNGLINFMNVDASEIGLSYVSDNVVKLSKSVRGIPHLTQMELSQYCLEL